MADFERREGKLFIDGEEVIRGWESLSGWYWFATKRIGVQDSLIDGKVFRNDTIWFGFVQGLFEEWGNFSQTELESIKPVVWEIPSENLPYSGRRQRKAQIAR